ncbi:MAG: hypothetical protein HYX51_00780 [Chloroflexi bacterium]|nr:hypothetical protein [Chloroflexota bacterium]
MNDGYILVQDPGVLGVAAEGLRIPFTAIDRVLPGERVVLTCTRDQVRLHFGRRGLEIDEHAKVTPF